MHGVSLPDPELPGENAWTESEPFLWGIDLFNLGYYWESHEVWEGLWIAAGRGGPQANALKGLIKLAAAGVKAYEGRTPGVQRHARRALELLSSVSAPEGLILGISRGALLELATSAASRPPSCEDAAPPVAGLIGAIPLAGRE